MFPYKLLFNGSASVVKTHERADDDGYVRFARFHRAILVLRNPYDAIKADFNQVYAGHTEMIPAKSFSKERKYRLSPRNEMNRALGHLCAHIG